MTNDNTKHTPGPWKVHEDADGPYVVMSALEGDDEFISVYAYASPRVNPEQRLADARLIGAAPDLLAALNRILDRATRVMNGELNVGSFGVAEYDAQVARAAIAKATGDAS